MIAEGLVKNKCRVIITSRNENMPLVAKEIAEEYEGRGYTERESRG